MPGEGGGAMDDRGRSANGCMWRGLLLGSRMQAAEHPLGSFRAGPQLHNSFLVEMKSTALLKAYFLSKHSRQTIELLCLLSLILQNMEG
jgi:hypothetical protein